MKKQLSLKMWVPLCSCLLPVSAICINCTSCNSNNTYIVTEENVDLNKCEFNENGVSINGWINPDLFYEKQIIKFPDELFLNDKMWKVVSIGNCIKTSPENEIIANTKTEKIILGKNIKTLDDQCFTLYKNLINIENIENIEYIGLNALGMTGFKQIELPGLSNKNPFETWALANCPNLESINILYVKEIGAQSVFSNNPNLVHCKLPLCINLQNASFQDCNNFLQPDIDIPLLRTISIQMFSMSQDKSNIKTKSLDFKNVKTLYWSAIENYKALESITFGDLTSMLPGQSDEGHRIIYGCDSLKEIRLPGNQVPVSSSDELELVSSLDEQSPKNGIIYVNPDLYNEYIRYGRNPTSGYVWLYSIVHNLSWEIKSL